MNHVKNLASEVETSSIDSLRIVMTALDFEPKSSKFIKQLGLVVQGARYCSIQGHIAIQIKLRDASGQQHSLYQASCPPSLQKLKPTTVNFDKVQVLMWIEDGLFMGLAGPLESPEV